MTLEIDLSELSVSDLENYADMCFKKQRMYREDTRAGGNSLPNQKSDEKMKEWMAEARRVEKELNRRLQ